MKFKLVKNKKIIWFLFLIFILLTLVILSKYFLVTPVDDQNKILSDFSKEGELVFLKKDTGLENKKIDIEIADNDKERSQGLMYRKSLPINSGMLFIMENLEMQSFWMKNTYLSLDIIFVDDNFKIVKIQKNTEPFSTDKIYSEKEAKFVVEVIAGFCDKNNIKEENYISYFSL